MYNNDRTDDDLLDALRRGGGARERAWEFICKNWRGVWVGTVVNRGGTPEDADEAFQSMYIKFQGAVTDPDFVLHSATLRTYLVQSVLNEWVRQRRPRPSTPGVAEPGPQFPEGQAERADKDIRREELTKAVDALINTLGKRCRRILRMFGEGYGMDEIAEAEGWKDTKKVKKEEKARKKKYECQEKLKKHLQENPGLANHLKDLRND